MLNKILKVKWITYTVMILFLFIFMGIIGFWHTLMLVIVGYICAVVGNAIRIYAMPDAYFTDGTLWSNIKTKLFWGHGPQVIGLIIGSFFYLTIIDLETIANDKIKELSKMSTKDMKKAGISVDKIKKLELLKSPSKVLSLSKNITKYNNLPIKNNLSYLALPKYFYGFALTKNNDELCYTHNHGINIMGYGNIDFPEFEFEPEKLAEYKKKALAECKVIYKKVKEHGNPDLHIKIINLNIPAIFKKPISRTSGVNVIFNKIDFSNKIDYKGKINKNIVIKKAIDNTEFLSTFPHNITDSEFSLEVIVDKGSEFYNTEGEFFINARDDLINEMGKINKGKDFITEITLFLDNDTKSRYITRYNYYISSFKLKSSNKRFVLQYDKDFRKNDKNYYIKEHDSKIF